MGEGVNDKGEEFFVVIFRAFIIDFISTRLVENKKISAQIC